MLQANGVSELPHLVGPISRTLLLVSVLVVIPCLIPGCGIGTFIGAYFNTYYNAQRQFKDAEDELLSQRENKQNDRPFGYPFNIQATTKAKFTTVIEKCSKLLQYHSESSLVDNALLMIGKSYYYQNDYQQAERKFKELLEQFPNSSLVDDGELLLGYCYYMLNDKTKSSGVAKVLLDNANKNGDDDYAAKASMLLAQIEADNKNPDQAKIYFQTAAEKGGTAEERCIAYLNLAALNTQEGNDQRALDAYRKAEAASPGFETTYKGKIGEARMLCKLGAYEESLRLLRDLLSSSNYKEFYGEISLEIGNVFKASKEYPSAIAQYTYVDTSYARTESSAKSYFQLGSLYETILFQFDSAYTQYTKGKSEFPQALITQQLTRRAEYLGKYLQYRNEIQKFDSIKSAILAPPDTARMSVTAASDSTVDSLHVPHIQIAASSDSTTDTIHARNLHLATVSDSTVDSLHKQAVVTPPRIPLPPPISLDSANSRLAYAKTELAALFYTVMGLPDSAEKWYMDLLIEHPGSKQAPRALYTLAQIYSQDSTRPRPTIDSLYRVIVERFPDSEFAPEAERQLGLPVTEKAVDPAETSYARAEGLINSGETKAARDTLRNIVHLYPASPIASKAQYALGWLYESVDVVPDSAVASYRKLVALYPGSRYALAARPKVEEYDLFKKNVQQHKDSIAAAARDSVAGKGREKSGNDNKIPDLGKQKELAPPTAKDSSAVKPREEEEKSPDELKKEDASSPPGNDKEAANPSLDDPANLLRQEC